VQVEWRDRMNRLYSRFRGVFGFGVAVSLTALALLGAGCAKEAIPAAAAAEEDPAVFTFELTVSTPKDLPLCRKSMSGTTAFVKDPPSLWSCSYEEWTEIHCSKMKAGAVAYSSTTKQLLACVQGKWTPISTSGTQGPPGAQGPKGDP